MYRTIVLSVVLGVALAAPQVFPQHAPLDQARNDFIREYNRLAALAAAAPDIHIIMGNHRTLDTLPAVPQVQTNHIVDPVFQGFENFGFTANLGQNQQFTPSGVLAGHLAGHQAAVAPPTQGPTLRWTGPLADTVPAGVNGLPTQVQDTPAVAAAKRAHFAALGHAYRLTPRAL